MILSLADILAVSSMTAVVVMTIFYSLAVMRAIQQKKQAAELKKKIQKIVDELEGDVEILDEEDLMNYKAPTFKKKDEDNTKH
jgi:hypothetical protein